MGSAVAADGSLAIQCQSCHGSMGDVAAPARRAGSTCRLPELSHRNGGAQQRPDPLHHGVRRVGPAARRGVDATFATTPDVPAAGLSLYRFSRGHGGLACEACHGSTHAEYPSSHRNDNIQASQLQGHVGTIAECATCHGVVPPRPTAGRTACTRSARTGSRVIRGGRGQRRACQSCHGTDYRGTVLSRAFGDRTLDTRSAPRSSGRDFRSAATPATPARRAKTGIRTPRQRLPMRPPRQPTTRRSSSRCRPATRTATRCS